MARALTRQAKIYLTDFCASQLSRKFQHSILFNCDKKTKSIKLLWLKAIYKKTRLVSALRRFLTQILGGRNSRALPLTLFRLTRWPSLPLQRSLYRSASNLHRLWPLPHIHPSCNCFPRLNEAAGKGTAPLSEIPLLARTFAVSSSIS